MVDADERSQVPAGGEGVDRMSMDELQRLNPIELGNIAYGSGETYEKLRTAYSKEDLTAIQHEALQIIARLEMDKVPKKK